MTWAMRNSVGRSRPRTYVQHRVWDYQADVIQDNPEPAISEGKPIGLLPMIDQARTDPASAVTCRRADRLDRPVARGQQFAQRSTRVGMGRERARDDTVDHAGFALRLRHDRDMRLRRVRLDHGSDLAAR